MSVIEMFWVMNCFLPRKVLCFGTQCQHELGIYEVARGICGEEKEYEIPVGGCNDFIAWKQGNFWEKKNRESRKLVSSKRAGRQADRIQSVLPRNVYDSFVIVKGNSFLFFTKISVVFSPCFWFFPPLWWRIRTACIIQFSTTITK